LIVDARPDRIVIGIRGPVFDRGSEELSLRAQKLLSQLASAMADEETPIVVAVRGYTDGTAVARDGRWPDNWTLGLARASAAARHLRSEWGGAPLELTAASAAGELPPGAASLGDPTSRSVDLALSVTDGVR
jgi:flagellar motor protein MotB